MQTIDLSALRENNEFWWEEVNLACPFCEDKGDGEGEYECNGSDEQELLMKDCEIIKDALEKRKNDCLTKCPVDAAHFDGESCNTCEFSGDSFNADDVCCKCDEMIFCEECTEGRIEILWDTGFGVYVPYGSDREELRKIACDNGFALISWGNEDWLLMSMCGLDCTWKIHYTRYAIQGYLDQEDINSCLSSGGYVFLGQKKKEELCKYFKESIPDPEAYSSGYTRDMSKIDSIVEETR